MEKLLALAAIQRPLVADPPRQLLEVCTEPDSRLGNKLFAGERCKTHRIAESDDIRTKASFGGANKVRMGAVTALLLWISIPCTGGCPWQTVNASRSEEGREKGHGSPTGVPRYMG